MTRNLFVGVRAKLVPAQKFVSKKIKVLKRFKKRNTTKFVALGVVMQMSMLTGGLSVVPASAHTNEKNIQSAELTLSKNESVFADETVKFSVGESNYTIEKNKQKSVKTTSTKSAAKLSIDQLRNIYHAVENIYGIDGLAEALEAVHQIESGKSWDTAKRSYAGATGPMQFMPSTFNHYCKTSGAGCNITSGLDSVYAAGNLLAKSYLKTGSWDGAFYNYNHSNAYVNKVSQIMASI